MHLYEIIYGEGKSHKTFGKSYQMAVAEFEYWYHNTFGAKDLPAHMTILKKEIH